MAKKINGTSKADTLYGTDATETIWAGAGNDLIIGSYGKDTIYGGAGSDTVDYSGYNGGVKVYLDGNKLVKAKGTFGETQYLSSIENLILGKGNDIVKGDSGVNIFRTGAGDDLIIGSYGRDKIYGGAGNDTVDYSGYNGGVSITLAGDKLVTAKGSFGDVQYLSSIENLILGNGNDVIRGDDRNNSFRGNGGDDKFYCSGGFDSYDGGSGFDTVDFTKAGTAITVKFTSANAATVYTSGVASDKLVSIEKIVGSAKGDTFYGSSGDNTFFGGAGDDKFFCSAGNDTYNGGTGFDTVDFTKAGTAITVKFTSASAATIYTSGVASEKLTSIEHIIGSDKGDTFYGSSADNTFSGGAGNDTFYCSAGKDTYYGGAGIDTVDYTKAGIALTISPAGTDSATVAAGGVVSDKLFSIENIIGSTYGDKIAGTAADNRIDGGAGDDTLHGGAGNDTLIGGTGKDTLTGGMGNDTLTGGAGADTFVFSTYEGKDVITDFQATGTGYDVLDLKGVIYFDSYAGLLANNVFQSGADVVLELLKGDQITLKGVDIADLSAANFLF